MTAPRLLVVTVLAMLAAVGCGTSSAPEQFQTYDALLSQENGGAGETQPVADPATAESSDTAAVSGQPEPSLETASSGSDIPASALAPLNLVDGTSTLDILKVRPAAADRSVTPEPVSALTVASADVPESATTPAVPVLSGGIRLLIPDRQFRIEGPREALRVSYDDLDLLKVLNMEPVPADATRYFPDWLASLNGKPIRIRGFMYPTFESSGIEQFVLARDNQICCFGRDPKVYDLIAVTMKSGATTDYIPNRPFDVVGTFRIDLLAEGGKPLGLYWIENATVIEK